MKEEASTDENENVTLNTSIAQVSALIESLRS